MGLRHPPIVADVSRRQGERASRYQAEIEAAVRTSALVFRADDVEASVTAAPRLWWTSHLRGRRFAQLVQHARAMTHPRREGDHRGSEHARKRSPRVHRFIALRSDTRVRRQRPPHTKPTLALRNSDLLDSSTMPNCLWMYDEKQVTLTLRNDSGGITKRRVCTWRKSWCLLAKRCRSASRPTSMYWTMSWQPVSRWPARALTGRS
jgi:hypothetical protein